MTCSTTPAAVLNLDHLRPRPRHAAGGRPPLEFRVVPQWGWRATEGDMTFEIERLSIDSGRKLAVQAWVRRRWRSEPLAKCGFAIVADAKAWLETQREGV